VGDEHDRLTGLPVQLGQHVVHVAGVCTVQVARRLVGEKELRLIDERTRDADALLFATGELAGDVVQAMAEPDVLEGR